MSSQFSQDGKYFAFMSTDNRLKIWETSTSTFSQEYVPDFHLTAPCTCLQFIGKGNSVKSQTPVKKKRKKSLEENTWIALGTTSGVLLMYSVNKGILDFKIDSKTKQEISCVSWCDGNNVFTGIEQSVFCWNLEDKTLESKWKAGNEKVNSILTTPNNYIITASRDIKLWHGETKELLKTFTGHSQEVSLLYYVPPPTEAADAYFISGSKGDRLLSVWNINEQLQDKSSIASFLCSDVPRSVGVLTQNGVSNVIAVTRNGVLQFYQHSLNGKCSKPLKARKTLHVATEASKESTTVIPIPIFGALLNDDLSVLIGHGSEFILTFENLVLTEHGKVKCLIRKDPHLTKKVKDARVTNIRTPVADNQVHYITPNTSTIPTAKRKKDVTGEIPMEKRLENLALTKLDDPKSSTKVNNVAHLLVQGLHSKDKTILKSVFATVDEDVIKNTIKRLPIPVIIPFVKEVTELIQGKTIGSVRGALWLKHFLHLHAGLLLSNPELPDMLGPLLTIIENRTALLQPFSRLKGRLDLLLLQTNKDASKTSEQEQDYQVLVCNDKVGDELAIDEMDIAPQSDSDSDKEWLEEEDEEEDEQEEEKEMSPDENGKVINGDENHSSDESDIEMS